MAKQTTPAFTESSGNVFADLGFKNPEEMVLRAELAMTIEAVIRSKGWTQTKAAECLGISQSDVSDITRGKVKKFTIDRLFHLLLLLKHDIKISVRHAPKNRSTGRLKYSHKDKATHAA